MCTLVRKKNIMATLKEIENITHLLASFRPQNVSLAENLMQSVDILGSQRHYGGLPTIHPRIQTAWNFYVAYKIAEAIPLLHIDIFSDSLDGSRFGFVATVVSAKGTRYSCDYLPRIRKVGDRLRLMLSDVYRVDAIAPMIESMKAEIWMDIVGNIKKDLDAWPSIRIDLG